MSDGHTDGYRRDSRIADIRDTDGRDCFVNDTVWVAGGDGTLMMANIIEVLPEGIVVLMTKSNSIMEVTFKPKNTITHCNYILRAK